VSACSTKLREPNVPLREVTFKASVLRTYQELKCLDTSFCNAIDKLLPPGTLFFFLTHVMINLAKIKIKTLPTNFWIMLLVSNFALCTVVRLYFQNGGNLCTASEELISQLRKTTDMKFRQRVASCQVLTANIGPYVSLRKSTTISYYNKLANYIIQALLFYS